MPRFKITLQYDGSKFFGWQMQFSERTVQGELEKCIAEFNKGDRVIVTGAGRTDTGVHAWGQVAHFDLKTDLDTCTLTKAFNSKLPDDIHVTDFRVVSKDFHARFSAKRRYYRYQCLTKMNVLLQNQTWVIVDPPMDSLNECAQLLLGKHDFKSFCKINPEIKDTRCQIYHSSWSKEQNMLTFHISGNRFLHHMVRYLVGTMIAIAKGKLTLEEFKRLIDEPNTQAHIFRAPPQGLILEKVDYDKA